MIFLQFISSYHLIIYVMYEAGGTFMYIIAYISLLEIIFYGLVFKFG